MRAILKTFFISALILFLISQAFQGLIFKNGLQTFFTASVALTISSLVVKPLINIMILPLNLITFGFFKWLSSAVALYIVTLIVPDFIISEFYFQGLDSLWFSLPAIKFGGLLAIICYSLTISVSNTFLHWLLK